MPPLPYAPGLAQRSACVLHTCRVAMTRTSPSPTPTKDNWRRRRAPDATLRGMSTRCPADTDTDRRTDRPDSGHLPGTPVSGRRR